MNIWLINHYAVPPQYYPLARQTYFAKHLMAMGHTVTIFAASTVHNSNQNLITDGRKWRDETVDGVHYVYIKCKGYFGNGLKRVYNICEFAWKLPGVCKQFQKPDAIVATSMPPTSCAVGIHLARKYKCKGVAEIADLWPESIVAHGIAGPKNPAVLLLRRLEKWIYKKADAIVFTMEGGYDYIVEQGWDKQIPRTKVYHINNGVDLELFTFNSTHNILDDPDLNDPNLFKVVYTGSVRYANGVNLLIDCAKELKDHKDIRLLIYGAGENLDELTEKCNALGLDNCVFKGPVPKTYIPYILSKSNLNLLNYNAQSEVIYRFGSSQNKLFEYLASGKLILCNVKIAYNLLDRYQCGITETLQNGKDYADAILKVYSLSREEYDRMCTNCKNLALQYDFGALTQKLLEVIEGE